MPTYEYVCDACGHELEIFQSMSEPRRRKCPDCGRLKLQRKIGMGAGVLFKGSGFYETDYRSESYKKGAEAEKKSKSESSSESKSKSDSKSETKKTPPKKDTGSKSDS